MDFYGVLVVVIGGLLLLGSIWSTIYVKSIGKEVKTWKPFGWSGFLGFLFLLIVAIFVGLDVPIPPSRVELEPLPTIVNVIGGLLLLGTLALSMYLSMNEKKKVSTWKPLVWGSIVGAIMLLASF